LDRWTERAIACDLLSRRFVGEIEGAGKLDVVVRLASSPSEEARFEGSLGVVEDLLDFRARETGRSPREWEMRSGLLMFT
jgi:hypothetical protein